MIFLIEYDRPKGHIVTFSSFHETERLEAENRRLEIEAHPGIQWVISG